MKLQRIGRLKVMMCFVVVIVGLGCAFTLWAGDMEISPNALTRYFEKAHDISNWTDISQVIPIDIENRSVQASEIVGVKLNAYNHTVKTSTAQHEVNASSVISHMKRNYTAYTNGSLSNDSCQPKTSVRRMTELFGSKFNQSLEPFLTNPTLQSPNILKYPPPFGFRKAEGEVRSLMKKLPKVGLPDKIKELTCRRCIVVGNGGLLLKSGLGSVIDGYDVVIRINMAPTKFFEKDVGSKTTMRLLYPESSSEVNYSPGWLLVVMAFKAADIRWVEHVIEGRKTSSAGSFWQRTALNVPKPKDEFRIFNPLLVSELASNLIGFTIGDGGMHRNTPTSGAMAIAMALRICDEVAVAGFGYKNLKPNDPVHYYNSKDTMGHFMRSFTHNYGPERALLTKLVAEGVIADLTKGLS